MDMHCSDRNNSRVEYLSIDNISCIYLWVMMAMMTMKKWKSHLKFYMNQTHPLNHDTHVVAVAIIMCKTREKQQEQQPKHQYHNVNTPEDAANE
eukprot:7768286-Ditylum_brightwellii.AAC.1